MSTNEQNFAVRAARAYPVTGRVAALDDPNSPKRSAVYTSAREPGERDTPSPGIPRSANVTSLRMPLPLYAIGSAR